MSRAKFIERNDVIGFYCYYLLIKGNYELNVKNPIPSLPPSLGSLPPSLSNPPLRSLTPRATHAGAHASLRYGEK